MWGTFTEDLSVGLTPEDMIVVQHEQLDTTATHNLDLVVGSGLAESGEYVVPVAGDGLAEFVVQETAALVPVPCTDESVAAISMRTVLCELLDPHTDITSCEQSIKSYTSAVHKIIGKAPKFRTTGKNRWNSLQMSLKRAQELLGFTGGSRRTSRASLWMGYANAAQAALQRERAAASSGTPVFEGSCVPVQFRPRACPPSNLETSERAIPQVLVIPSLCFRAIPQVLVIPSLGSRGRGLRDGIASVKFVCWLCRNVVLSVALVPQRRMRLHF